MSADRDITRIVRSWLRTDEPESADRVLDNVLARLDATPQRRSLWPARRIADMNTYAKVAIAAAAVVVIAVIAINQLPASRVDGIGASPSPTVRRSPSPAPAGASLDAGVLAPGRNSLRIDGVPFSLTVPPGWEGFGSDYPNYISKSIRGPQGAEGVVFWTGFRDNGEWAEACYYLRNQPVWNAPVGPSAADLAAAVSAVPGTDLLSGPSDVIVGGRPTKHVVLAVREDVGCDPGFFFTYPNVWGGALWPETVPGDTVRVWIVDMGGRLLFIEGKTHPDAGPKLELEIEQIVNSIQFE